MHLSLVLRGYYPSSFTDESTSDQKNDLKMWEKLNRMCMMIMNKAILEAFRAYMSKKINTSKEFLAETEKKVCQERKGKNRYALDKSNFNKV